MYKCEFLNAPTVNIITMRVGGTVQYISFKVHDGTFKHGMHNNYNPNIK